MGHNRPRCRYSSYQQPILQRIGWSIHVCYVLRPARRGYCHCCHTANAISINVCFLCCCRTATAIRQSREYCPTQQARCMRALKHTLIGNDTSPSTPLSTHRAYLASRRNVNDDPSCTREFWGGGDARVLCARALPRFEVACPLWGVVGLAVFLAAWSFHPWPMFSPSGGIRGLRPCRLVFPPLARTGGVWEMLLRWEVLKLRLGRSKSSHGCLHSRPTQVPRNRMHAWREATHTASMQKQCCTLLAHRYHRGQWNSRGGTPLETSPARPTLLEPRLL